MSMHNHKQERVFISYSPSVYHLTSRCLSPKLPQRVRLALRSSTATASPPASTSPTPSAATPPAVILLERHEADVARAFTALASVVGLGGFWRWP